jgi:hypothetical protein
VSSGALTLSLQLFALTALSAADYGRFALGYLLLGLGFSASFSFVLDVWVRSRHTLDWDRYAPAMFWFALVFGLVSFSVLLVVGGAVPQAAVFGAAIATAVYRNGARFYDAYFERWRFVVIADAGALLMLLVSFGVLLAIAAPYDALLVSWLLSNATASALSRAAPLRPPTRLVQWVRQHWREIRGLWAETALQDVSNLGTPLLLFPLMTPADFGVYRSVSSAAIPARLAVFPLRANLSRFSREWYASWRAPAALAVTGLFFGILVLGILLLVRPLGVFPDSVLPALSDFAVPAAVFTFGVPLSFAYYVAARAYATARQLRWARMFETLVMVAGPLGGLLVAGLPGAIWAFAIGSVVGALGWMTVIRWRQPGPAGAPA